MLFENFPLPLPWYPGVRFQDRFRQNVAMDPRILQLAPFDGVLPFQFGKAITSELPVTWDIRCAQSKSLDYYTSGGVDDVVVDLAAFIPYLQTTSLNGLDYLTWVDDENVRNVITSTVPDGLSQGAYYMQMTFAEPEDDGGETYVSELFRVPDDRFSWVQNSEDCNYPCLIWSNDSDIAPMHYDPGAPHLFFNKLYLDSFITASEPVVETEIKQDGKGEPFPLSHKTIIKYRLSSLVPDFVKISLYAMMMHENKSIILERGYRFGAIKNPEVTHKLTSDGAYSEVELLFEQMSLLFDTQCAENMVEPDPYSVPGGITLDTEYCDGSGDLFLQTTTTPDGVYGKMQYSTDGGATYIEYNLYISRISLNTGITLSIPSGLGADHFMIAYYTFTDFAGFSDVSIPVASC